MHVFLYSILLPPIIFTTKTTSYTNGCMYEWHLLKLFFSFSRMGSNRLYCQNHPNAPLVEDYRAGDMVCPECGLVVGDR